MNNKLIILLVLASFFFSSCTTQMAPSPAPLPERAPQVLSSLVLVGETEYVILKPDNIRMAARIDTGATTSSIGASDIKNFERDGKKWVKFTITDPSTKKSVKMSRPVTRTIEVKRHGMDAQKRVVVTLPIIMGPIEQKAEFSLTDRSAFKYPVLIGRNFLRGVAVVDVNQEYLLSPLGNE